MNQNAEKQRPFLAGNSILWLGSKYNHKYFAVGANLVCSRANTRFAPTMRVEGAMEDVGEHLVCSRIRADTRSAPTDSTKIIRSIWFWCNFYNFRCYVDGYFSYIKKF